MSKYAKLEIFDVVKESQFWESLKLKFSEWQLPGQSGSTVKKLRNHVFIAK